MKLKPACLVVQTLIEGAWNSQRERRGQIINTYKIEESIRKETIKTTPEPKEAEEKHK